MRGFVPAVLPAAVAVDAAVAIASSSSTDGVFAKKAWTRPHELTARALFRLVSVPALIARPGDAVRCKTPKVPAASENSASFAAQVSCRTIAQMTAGVVPGAARTSAHSR